MPDFDKDEFKFPDEADVSVDTTAEDKLEIEIEDDTPEDDRGREPISKEAVKKIEVETDELDAYSQDAKDKIIKMKRVWHDERRAKEAAMREQQEAVELAKRLMEENKRIKEMLSKEIGRAHV